MVYKKNVLLRLRSMKICVCKYTNLETRIAINSIDITVTKTASNLAITRL